MIGGYREKVNTWVREHRSDLFIAAVIFLVGLGSFGLGRLSVVVPEKPLLTISGANIADGAAPTGSVDVAASAGDAPQRAAISAAGCGDTGARGSVSCLQQRATSAAGRYVGSKSGAAYHLPWCPGALRIKEQNKIWFQTTEEAEQKGYKPAANCPGL